MLLLYIAYEELTPLMMRSIDRSSFMLYIAYEELTHFIVFVRLSTKNPKLYIAYEELTPYLLLAQDLL